MLYFAFTLEGVVVLYRCLGREQGCVGADEGTTYPGMVLMGFLARDPQTRIIFDQHGLQR